MKHLITIISLVLLSSLTGFAQSEENWGINHHLSFGYTTQTGNFGPNGFEVGADYRFRRFLAFIGEGSFMFNNDRVNDVRTTLSPTGFTDVKISTNAQNYQGGPRFFFPKAFRKARLVPFAHLLFGVSRQSTNFELAASDADLGSSTDTSWSWALGGGVDYWFNRNWAVRGKIDLLKTHFLDDSQTHARFAVGISYDFGHR